MSPNNLKTMFYLMGTILTIYPIIDILRKKMRWYFKVILIIIIGGFIWVAFAVKSIEDSENLADKKKSDSAYHELKNENVILSAKADTTKIYLQNMEELIKRANLPEDKKKVINNYIKEVKTLNEN